MSFEDPHKPYEDDPDGREHEHDERLRKRDREDDHAPAAEQDARLESNDNGDD